MPQEPIAPFRFYTQNTDFLPKHIVPCQIEKKGRGDFMLEEAISSSLT